MPFNANDSRRISPPVKRRLVILAVSSIASCIFFSSQKYIIKSPEYAEDYEVAVVELPTSTVTVTAHSPDSTETDAQLDHPRLLNRVAASFRDALLPETNYVTSFPTKDWGNQVIAFTNLIYLSLITERIPILPSFSSVHRKGSGLDLDFGEVFDLVRLQKEINHPVLEWYQVKDPQSLTVDVLGCWSTVNETLRTSQTKNLRLDISHSPTPDWTRLGSDRKEQHSLFWPLASLAFTDTDALVFNTEPSLIHGIAVAPDRHLFCVDDLSLVSALNSWEHGQEMSPAWRFVGQHMRWKPKIQAIANKYIRKAFGLGSADHIPPYIVVHVRHNEWQSWCERPVEECLAPLSAYARRVQEVKTEIQRKNGTTVERVLMTSDEVGSLWWGAVRKRHWARLDHSETAKRYGAWYPAVIDEVVASSALGFVATDRPMTGVLAGRRVASWNGGVVRMVPWETRPQQPEDAQVVLGQDE